MTDSHCGPSVFVIKGQSPITVGEVYLQAVGKDA